MLREAISLSEHFFMPPIQELIQLIFLSLYIKGDIFTWLPFSEYLLKSNRESLLLCVLFPEVCICYIKNTEQVMNYFLDMLHMFCPYFFPVTCLSAKTTISLIDFRKGKVLILKWDILKERLNCKKKKQTTKAKQNKNLKKTPKKTSQLPDQGDCIYPGKWTFWLSVHGQFWSEVREFASEQSGDF